MRRIFSFAVILLMLCCNNVFGQVFDDYFTNQTLRIDYIFSGNVKQQCIAVDQLNVMPEWYGKRQRLSEIPVEGNGQITIREHKSRQVIYRNSFSTLFQEWLSYEEATIQTKAFENVFLVPMPKDTAEITIELRNNRREVTTSLTHRVVPNDILIKRIGERNLTPHTTIQQATSSKKIHIAYLAEGYTQEEMPKFLEHVKTANEALFSHEPFKSMRERFHVVAVESPSIESGTSEPSKGIWRNTALHSHFDTFYSNRYLTTLSLKTLHNWLAGIPYEHIIVLVNTDQYGGGGILNSYNLSMTGHKLFKPVVVHEFGHSFAGLADEYAYEGEPIEMYPNDIEPWEANITTLKDFKSKWQDMIKKGTPTPTPLSTDKKTIETRIGLFEGAGYKMKGVYRACQDCRMRTNTTPEFCPVCQKALTELIDFYTK
ncbi:MAG: M64 family metallopeptidase [Prevotella sp.]|nr:M64 family metallopeptidase [Prevotella sp.]